jgi:hypothetical protein
LERDLEETWLKMAMQERRGRQQGQQARQQEEVEEGDAEQNGPLSINKLEVRSLP